MGRRLHILRKILSGDVHSAAQHAKVSPHSVERIAEAFDALVDDGVLYEVYGNHYVVADVADEAEAMKRIRSMSATLSSETDDTTTVSVSGALVEDTTFETDSEPSDVVR